MSTPTALELEYTKLLEKHKKTEADIKPPAKNFVGLIKSAAARYNKTPTEGLLQTVKKYDVLLCNAIQDLVEEPLPDPVPDPIPTPDPVPDPIPTPDPVPDPIPVTKTAAEEQQEKVLEIINGNSEKCIREHELETILGAEPGDPYQEVGTITLRRQLHGKYYIYKR